MTIEYLRKMLSVAKEREGIAWERYGRAWGSAKAGSRRRWGKAWYEVKKIERMIRKKYQEFHEDETLPH